LALPIAPTQIGAAARGISIKRLPEHSRVRGENCIETEPSYAATTRSWSRAEIERKRAEIRQGLAEIAQDRREIRDDLGQLRRNRDHYGYGWGNDGWNRDRRDRNDNGWWGWGNNRWDNRDRWGQGYGRD
jgi:hypothetical protein